MRTSSTRCSWAVCDCFARHRQDPPEHGHRRGWHHPACKRVRFYSTVDLVNALEQEKNQGKAGRIALSLLRIGLVILNELVTCRS